jgi:hypothetical protein
MIPHGLPFTCHFCGYDVTDEDDAKYGWCRHCKDSTGMCAAGRRVMVYDLLGPRGGGLIRPVAASGRPRPTGPSPRWDVPCVTPAYDMWELTLDGVDPTQDALCPAHGDQLQNRLAPGICGIRVGPVPRPTPRHRLIDRLAVRFPGIRAVTGGEPRGRRLGSARSGHRCEPPEDQVSGAASG